MTIVLTRKHAILATIIFAFQFLSYWRILHASNCAAGLFAGTSLAGWYFTISLIAPSALFISVVVFRLSDILLQKNR